MVLISFLLILALLGVSAVLARDIGDVLNLDSIVINIVVILIFTLAINGWKMLSTVLKMTVFSHSNLDKNELSVVIPQLKGLMYANIVGGLLSTIQGIYSGVALGTLPFEISIYYASITTFYALIIAFFLFYPILIQLENEYVNFK